MEQQASLFAKIAAIMGEIDRVPKAGSSEQLKYKFAKDNDVFDLVRAKLAEHRIAFFAETYDDEQDSITSKYNTPGYHTRIKMRFTFACGDTGQTFTCEWRAESDAYDDKGISKAQTLGMKYFLLKTFVLSTGDPKDDPDSVSEEASARAPKRIIGRDEPAPGPAQRQRGTSDEPPAETMRAEMPPAALEEDPIVERARRTFPFNTADKMVHWKDYMKGHKSWNVGLWTAAKALGLDEKTVHAGLNLNSITEYNGTTGSLWFAIVKLAPPEQQELPKSA